MTDYTALRTHMVDSQVRPSDVTKYPVIDAMLSVPRESFVPEDKRNVAYAGMHLPIAPGRVVVDPRLLAKMLDVADPGRDDLVLEIGAGLGYATAVIARMAEAVIAVESDADLAARAEANLAAEGADNAVVLGAPMTGGAPRHGPYDVILFSGAVEDLPEAIPDQLKDGGRLVAVFAEGGAGHCRVGVKTAGKIAWRDVFDALAPVLPGFEKAPGFVF